MSILTNAALLSVDGNRNVILSVGGQALSGFTKGSWSISAESTEQSVELALFTDTPRGRAYPAIKVGEDATVSAYGLVYVTGEIAKRVGKVSKAGYSLQITVKSKGKKLQKATAKIGKGQAINTAPKKLLSELAQNADVRIEFGDIDDEIIKQHISIGDRDTDQEMKSIARDRGYLIYETHEGVIRVEGHHEGEIGCDLIVGVNVVEASVSESNEKERGKIKTVGTRNLSAETNRQATLTPPGEAQMSSKLTSEFIRWADGDQTPKSLQRLADYEANRRVAEGKEATVKLFTLRAPDGTPLRANAKHFVSVPSEGLADVIRLKSADFSFDKSEEEVTVKLSPIASLSNRKAKAKTGAAKAKAKLAQRVSGQDSFNPPVQAFE